MLPIRVIDISLASRQPVALHGYLFGWSMIASWPQNWLLGSYFMFHCWIAGSWFVGSRSSTAGRCLVAGRVYVIMVEFMLLIECFVSSFIQWLFGV